VYLTEARARASTPLPSTIAQDLVLDAKATLVERPSGRER
jgi:hypothetical protein